MEKVKTTKEKTTKEKTTKAKKKIKANQKEAKSKFLKLISDSQSNLAKLERMKLVFKKILHEIFSNSHHKQRVLLGIFLMVISLQI